MKIINLNTTNEIIELKKFAGGECHLKFLVPFLESDKVHINIRINSSDDLMNLCLAVDALRNMFVSYIEVFIPYLPYARQDRVMTAGEPLSVKVFASIINSLNLNKVIIFDAHSDVSVALINNCININNYEMVKYFINEFSLPEYTLVSPDLGAYKKIDKLAQQLAYKGTIATGIKIRDLETGRIIKSDVITDDLNNRPCIVIDDICDGGRTFIELAVTLKAKNAGPLYFIASHGIFSHNAIERLKDAGYTRVCCSNSIAEREGNEFFSQYKLF